MEGAGGPEAAAARPPSPTRPPPLPEGEQQQHLNGAAVPHGSSSSSSSSSSSNGTHSEAAAPPPAQPPQPPIGSFAAASTSPPAPAPAPAPPKQAPAEEGAGGARAAALAALDEEEIDDDALSLSSGEEQGNGGGGLAQQEQGEDDEETESDEGIASPLKVPIPSPPPAQPKPAPAASAPSTGPVLSSYRKRSHENVKLPATLKGVQVVGQGVQDYIIEWVRADGGPKTGPTKYDYLRRLARFFNRMQAEPSLDPHLYVNPEAGEGEVKVFKVHSTLEELQAFLLVPPVAKFTNDFRTLAREKADKAVVNMLLRILDLKEMAPYGSPSANAEGRLRLPETLRGVEILAPGLQGWLIDKIRADTTRSDGTKCRYINKLVDLLLIIQAKPALATEPLLNDAPAPAPGPEPPTNAANQQEGGTPAPSSPPAPAAASAPPTADAASADATAAVAAGEGKEEEALAGPRRPVLLEDAAAFKAFFLRPPVKAYVLGHYKQKMLLEHKKDTATILYLLDLLGLKMTKKYYTVDDIVEKGPQGRKRGWRKTPSPALPPDAKRPATGGGGGGGESAVAVVEEGEKSEELEISDDEEEDEEDLVIEMSDEDM